MKKTQRLNTLKINKVAGMSTTKLVVENEEGETEEITIDINEIYAARRKVLSVNMSSKLITILDKLRKTIILDNGRPVPWGPFVEDLILFVLENEKRVQEFLDEYYPIEPGD